MMRRYAGRLETGAMVVTFLKLCGAGAILASICYGAHVLFFHDLSALRFWQKAIDLFLTIAIGAFAFFATAYALRVAEVQDVVVLARKRFGPQPSA
jgi:hypothetical protein